MATSEPATDEHTCEGWISESRRLAGVAVLAVSLAGWIAWFGWRIQCIGLHLICLTELVLEAVGALAGIAIAVGLLAADSPRGHQPADRRESHRFALGIADILGRTRSIDLHRDVRWLARHIRDDRRRSPADVAMAAVLLDGPRRLALVVVVTIALLIGVPPIPMPPIWALAAGAVATIGMSVALVLLAGGRVRFGDRTRWSFAAVGEIVAPNDRDGLAPRRWVGAVAAVVVISLAVALRGISDRWTHGLTPMTPDDRVAAMMFALFLVAGALYTLRTTATPELDNAHLVSRHLEERTARHSAIGGAVIVGLVGLIAGVLPGNVDAADDDVPDGVEHVSNVDTSGARPQAEVGGG